MLSLRKVDVPRPSRRRWCRAQIRANTAAIVALFRSVHGTYTSALTATRSVVVLVAPPRATKHTRCQHGLAHYDDQRPRPRLCRRCDAALPQHPGTLAHRDIRHIAMDRARVRLRLCPEPSQPLERQNQTPATPSALAPRLRRAVPNSRERPKACERLAPQRRTPTKTVQSPHTTTVYTPTEQHEKNINEPTSPWPQLATPRD